MDRRLTLTSEHLTELTAGELSDVVAARLVTNPCPLPTHALTGLIDRLTTTG